MFQHVSFVVSKLEKMFSESSSNTKAIDKLDGSNATRQRRMSLDVLGEQDDDNRLPEKTIVKMRRCSMSVDALNVPDSSDRRKSSPGQLAIKEEDGRQSRCEYRSQSSS
jgi:hypothetical protein